MPNTYKVLGQLATVADSDTDLYTVGAGKSVVCSTLNVCNRGASAITFRIAIRVNGEALTAKQYISYDVPIAANDSLALTLGLTLAAGDVVTVRTNGATVSFSLFGTEIT